MLCWGLGNIDSYARGVAKVVASIFIPEANMPLFTCLSGYLFAHMLASIKPSEFQWNRIVYKKFLRLVIPFVVLGTLANLSVPDRPLSAIMWGEGSSLWFCMMLFWVVLLRVAVLSLPSPLKYFRAGVLLLSLVISLVGNNYSFPHYLYGIPVGFLGFSRAFFFYFFFELGEFIYAKREILARMTPLWLSVLIVFYLAMVLMGMLHLRFVSYACLKASVFTLPLVLFCSAYKVGSVITYLIPTAGGGIREFCRCAFGIYVLHEQFSWNCYHTSCLVNKFLQYPIIYALCFSVTTLVLCYGLTYLILKNKIGRFLFS